MASFGLYDIFDIDQLEKKDKVAKTRHWVEVVYPESAPEDWIDHLKSLHLPFAVSPLHDQDLNEAGEDKKPHYHIIVCFDGPTTLQNANRYIQKITNGTVVQPCFSMRGAFRYFCHLDDPNKYQYSQDDVQTFNSFEVTVTEAEEDLMKKAIFNIIIVNQITEFAELVVILEFHFGYQYAKIARRNHSYINAVINSIRHSPGCTYKRFLKYVNEEEFDTYALDEDHTYQNSYMHLSKKILEFEQTSGTLNREKYGDS